MSKKYTYIIVVVLALIGALAIFHGLTKSRPAPEKQGKLVIAATDVAPAVPVTAPKIEGVLLSTDKIEAQKSDGTWVLVFNVPLQINLTELKASQKFSVLGQGFIDPGTYSQIRLHVMGVTMRQAKTPPATVQLASDEWVVPVKAVVEAKKTSSIVLDFQLDKSLHTTAKGKYILIPAVAVESRSNVEASVAPDNIVTISSGNVEDKKNVGMDLDGSFKTNFILNSNLDIVNGKIQAVSQ